MPDLNEKVKTETLEILIELLDEDVFQKFIYNLFKFNTVENIKLKLNKISIRDIIDMSFIWASTNEDHDYWHKIDHNFRRELQKRRKYEA